MGGGYHTLGQWLAAKLERALWMRFWETHNLDPRRVRPCVARYTFPNPIDALLSKGHLIEFWRTRTIAERKTIVGKLGLLVHAVLFNTSANRKGAAAALTAIGAPQPTARVIRDANSDVSPQHVDYLKLLESLIQLSGEDRVDHLVDTVRVSATGVAATAASGHLRPESNVFVPVHRSRRNSLASISRQGTQQDSEKAFIETLYFSPLNRIGTPYDVILRRIAQR
jgi:hypothetical protein